MVPAVTSSYLVMEDSSSLRQSKHVGSSRALWVAVSDGSGSSAMVKVLFLRLPYFVLLSGSIRQPSDQRTELAHYH